MSKYHWSSIRLILIILTTAFIWVYWLNLEIGYGVIFLLVAVGYTIYHNFIAAKEEKSQKKNTYNES